MKKEEANKALTAKLKAFCLFYAISNNATDSAKKAGYVDYYCSSKKLMAKPFVLEFIAALRKDMLLDYTAQTEYCISQWKELVLLTKKQGDYSTCACIVLKISRMKLPITNTNMISGLIKINIT